MLTCHFALVTFHFWFLFFVFLSLDHFFMSEWLLRGNEMENEKGERVCPTLLKIDVEGMEESILRGSTRIIQTCQPILYVENNCI